MLIGLYGAPTNPRYPDYRGLFRRNDLFEFMDDPPTSADIAWLFDHSTDGMYVVNTRPNQQRMQRLFSNLAACRWLGDLLLIGELAEEPPDAEHPFLGYDIVGSSLYFSPLGDGFLLTYDPQSTFDQGLSERSFASFRQQLNPHGLFSERSVAVDFASHCNRISAVDGHAVETEHDWRPVKIYLVATSRQCDRDKAHPTSPQEAAHENNALS